MATVIVKVTETCNARCAYCDVVRKQAPARKMMPDRVLERLFIRTNEFLTAHPDQSMDLVWHGGEPLLAGPDFFARAREFQETRCTATGQRINHFLQTNLTLFSRRFVPALRELGIDHLGTSYEPLPGLRGIGGPEGWQAYNRAFMAGLKAAEEAGFGWGMIYVVTRPALDRAEELFHFLTNLVPNGAVMFNPVLFYGPDPDDLGFSPDRYTGFLARIFRLWHPHRKRFPAVEPFRSLRRNIVQGQRRLSCAETGRCAETHFNLNPEGRLSQCGRADDWGLLDYGSIFGRSLDEVLADPQRDQLRLRNRVLRDGPCGVCRLWDICHGGCPLDSWPEHGELTHRSPWCRARRDFIREHFEPAEGVRFQPNGPDGERRAGDC